LSKKQDEGLAKDGRIDSLNLVSIERQIWIRKHTSHNNETCSVNHHMVRRLIILDGAFLVAAYSLRDVGWAKYILVIAAVSNVPFS